MFPEAARPRRWQDVLDADVDAVLVLTPGSHAPIAVAAAEAGLHVFAEKPMCITPAEGEAMLAAARRSGATLMVGYMKRYDPAYEALAAELDRDAVVAARITTLESPIEPYADHHPRRRRRRRPRRARGAARGRRAARRRGPPRRRGPASAPHLPRDPARQHGPRAQRRARAARRARRPALGADLARRVSATLGFGATEAVFLWVDLPGIARYEQDWSFYGADARATLRFPSPLLRSEPTQLVLEGGSPGTTASWRTERTVSYAQAFKRELEAFHDAIVTAEPPRTGGQDALRDVALSLAIVQSSSRAVRSGPDDPPA